MARDIYYLKFGETRFDLTDDGISLNDNISLTFKNDNYTEAELKSLFSNIKEGITIYGCILQDDGTETDEFIASHYDQYSTLQSITYDNDQDLYTVKLVDATNE